PPLLRGPGDSRPMARWAGSRDPAGYPDNRLPGPMGSGGIPRPDPTADSRLPPEPKDLPGHPRADSRLRSADSPRDRCSDPRADNRPRSRRVDNPLLPRGSEDSRRPDLPRSALLVHRDTRARVRPEPDPRPGILPALALRRNRAPREARRSPEDSLAPRRSHRLAQARHRDLRGSRPVPARPAAVVRGRGASSASPQRVEALHRHRRTPSGLLGPPVPRCAAPSAPTGRGAPHGPRAAPSVPGLARRSEETIRWWIRGPGRTASLVGSGSP